MSINGPHVSSTSSSISSSPKASQQATLPPLNNESNDDTFHVNPQGISPIEIQENTNLDKNTFHASKILDHIPSYTPILVMCTPNSPMKDPSLPCPKLEPLQESSMIIQTPTLSL